LFPADPKAFVELEKDQTDRNTRCGDAFAANAGATLSKRKGGYVWQDKANQGGETGCKKFEVKGWRRLTRKKGWGETKPGRFEMGEQGITGGLQAGIAREEAILGSGFRWGVGKVCWGGEMPCGRTVL